MYLKAMCIALIYDRTMYYVAKAMCIATICDRTVYISKSYVYCSDL